MKPPSLRGRCIIGRQHGVEIKAHCWFDILSRMLFSILIPYTDWAHNAHSVPFDQSKNTHSVPSLSGVLDITVILFLDDVSHKVTDPIMGVSHIA